MRLRTSESEGAGTPAPRRRVVERTPAGRVLALQRSAGNQAVGALLRRRLARAPATEAPLDLGFEVPIDRLLDEDELLIRFVRAYRGLASDEEAQRVRLEENWHWTGSPPVVTEAHVRAGFLMLRVSDLSKTGDGLGTLPPWLRSQLATLTHAEWEEYRSRTTVRTRDRARFAASVERFIAEIRERRTLAEARDTLAQSLLGLEALYGRYRHYRQALAYQHLRPAPHEIDIDRPDVAALRAELERDVRARGFEDLADFERTVEAYAQTFQAEALGLARELLDRYEHALGVQAERYREEATVEALFEALAATPAREHFEAAAAVRPPASPLTFDEIAIMDAAIGQRHSDLALGEKAVEGLAGEHPLLGNWDFDREAVATASRPDVQRQLLRYIRERRHDIAHTRRNLAANPELVFRLTPLLEATSALGRVEPGSVLERIVRDRAAQARSNDAMTDLVIGTLALAVGFLTAGGGVVLMLGGMALTAGLGGWQTARELHRYEVMEAAAGAQLAAPEDRESLAWAVLALGATGLDAVGLGLALDGLRPALVAFNGSGDLLALKEAIAAVPLPPQARASVLEAARLRAREAAAWRPARRAGVLAYDVLAAIAERFGSFAYAVLTSVRARSRAFAAFLDSAEALKKTGRHTLEPDVLAKAQVAFDGALADCDRMIHRGQELGFDPAEIEDFLRTWARSSTLTADDVLAEMPERLIRARAEAAGFGPGQTQGFFDLRTGRPTLTAPQIVEEIEALRRLRPQAAVAEGLPPSLTNPGLVTPFEQGILDDYVDGLRRLREARERHWLETTAAKPNERRRQQAEQALEDAKARLAWIEGRAFERDTEQLLEDLAPLLDARRFIETTPFQQQGGRLAFEAPPVGSRGLPDQGVARLGERLECRAVEAVREAGIRLRDSSLQEISVAIGLAMTRRKLPTRSSPGQALTGAGRYEWVFEDDSKLVVDWPQRLDDRAGRPESAKVPHAELHGPHGERLDEQGIVVPERSNPAHMPITIGQRGN